MSCKIDNKSVFGDRLGGKYAYIYELVATPRLCQKMSRLTTTLNFFQR